MAVTLTVAEAEALTCTTGITDADIAVARTHIYYGTGLNPDYHEDGWAVSAEAWQMAWAVVAARIGQAVKEDASASALAVTSEVQGDYQYAADIATLEIIRRDPLHGLPRTLLMVAHVTTGTWRPGRGTYV